MSQPTQKPHRSKQDYQTPADFIAAVKKALKIERFAFDFAADASNAQVPIYHFEEAIGQHHYFDEKFNALRFTSWASTLSLVGGGWGWVNPPYTDIGQWAERCMKTGQDGGSIALLVPASVGANWFRDYVHDHAHVAFLNGRLGFMPDKPKWLYPKDCILALYGPSIEPGYEVWNWRQTAERKVA